MIFYVWWVCAKNSDFFFFHTGCGVCKKNGQEDKRSLCLLWMCSNNSVAQYGRHNETLCQRLWQGQPKTCHQCFRRLDYMKLSVQRSDIPRAGMGCLLNEFVWWCIKISWCVGVCRCSVHPFFRRSSDWRQWVSRIVVTWVLALSIGVEWLRNRLWGVRGKTLEEEIKTVFFI